MMQNPIPEFGAEIWLTKHDTNEQASPKESPPKDEPPPTPPTQPSALLNKERTISSLRSRPSSITVQYLAIFWFLYSWFSVLIGLWISFSKTHTLPNLFLFAPLGDESIQPADIGLPTGNGKKISCSQAQLGQATCLAVAYFLSIYCGPSYVRRL